MKALKATESDLLTVEQVAPILGITPKLVYQMASAKFPAERRIPCCRLGPKGGKLRFRLAEIEAYVNGLRQRGPTPS